MRPFLNLKSNFILIILLLNSLKSFGQTNDIELIKTYNMIEKIYPERKVEFMKAKKKSILAKVNPLRLMFGSLLYVYQKGISPQISRQCPYEISCSSYSKQSIQNFGVFKGLALSADRMSRCTKMASYDVKPSNINLKTYKIIDSLSFYHSLHFHYNE
jgi:uncharacterized protein